MTPEMAIELIKNMVMLAVSMAAPLLLAGMVVGLMVSLFQAVTSIQEQTLTFVPKALAVLAVLIVSLPWMLRKVSEFAVQLIQKMPDMVK
jgi:flagellar biosynthesis protein FliQ